MKHIFFIFLVSGLSMSMGGRRSTDMSSVPIELNIILSAEGLQKLGLSPDRLRGQICELSQLRQNNAIEGERGCFASIDLSGRARSFSGTVAADITSFNVENIQEMVQNMYIFKSQNGCWFQLAAGFHSQSSGRQEQSNLLFQAPMPNVNCPDFANSDSRGSGKSSGVSSEDGQESGTNSGQASQD